MQSQITFFTQHNLCFTILAMFAYANQHLTILTCLTNLNVTKMKSPQM